MSASRNHVSALKSRHDGVIVNNECLWQCPLGSN